MKKKRTVNVKRHTKRRGRINVRSHPRKIKVPPAWKKVKFHKGKAYVATGIDSKGRLQYIYPIGLVSKGQKRKYKRIEQLENKMPSLMGHITHDAKQGKQEAQAVYTLFKTGFRPGTEKETKAEKEAFGAITLQNKHVKLKPNNVVKFDFIGKKGIQVKKDIKDKRLTDIMKERLNDEKIFDTNATQVRNYFKKVAGKKYQLKDLRTLKAREIAKKTIKKGGTKTQIINAVSSELSNTPKIALQSYIAPSLIKEK